MTPPDDDSLLPAINSKLQSLAGPEHLWPAWYRQWLKLGPESSDAERVAACQAIWDSRELPEDAGFSLVVWQINEIADRLAETRLNYLTDRMEAIEAEYESFHHHAWQDGDEPAEYTEVFLQYDQACSDIFIECLNELGESEVADYYERDFKTFNSRYERGLKYFESAKDRPSVASQDDLVRIASFATPVEADIARVALENEGIRLMAGNVNIAQLSYGKHGVTLYVQAKDEARAVRVLQSIHTRTPADGSKQDCPECGQPSPSGWEVCWKCGHIMSDHVQTAVPAAVALDGNRNDTQAGESALAVEGKHESAEEPTTPPNESYVPIFEALVLLMLLGLFMYRPVVGAFAIPVGVILIVLYRRAMDSEVDEL